MPARAGGKLDAAVVTTLDGSVELRRFDGTARWHASVAPVNGLPRLVAAGDFTGDGITDYAIWARRDSDPPATCGVTRMQTSTLVFLDGASGAESQPVGPLSDICWPALGYPTHQLDFGTVYIGDFEASYRGNEVVVVPYYATAGTVWNFAQTHAWQQVSGRGGRQSFTYPSVPEFDSDYAAANGRACSSLGAGEPCYIPDSHVPNAVFVRPGSANDLFTLTSNRAVLYRADLTPTGDVTWLPGGTSANGGRNYGLVESYRYRGRSYVDLIGGCSVEYSRRAVVTGAPDGGDPLCGIVRHLERFRIARGAAIVREGGVYYGFYWREGAFEGRVEYPAHPRAAIGGRGTSWTAFNVFSGGRWSIQIFAGPAALKPALVLPNWFVWDTAVLDGSGQAMLLASRIAPGTSIPGRGFDVLRWSPRGFHSIHHSADVVPALVRLACTPTRHMLDSNIFSSLTSDLDGDGTAEVLVEDAAQQRSWLDWR